MEFFPSQCPQPSIHLITSIEPRQDSFFDEMCLLNNPTLILELGSWMGASAIRWVQEAQKYTRPTVYCVDTWLGSVEHYLDAAGPEWSSSKLLLGECGASFFDVFLASIHNAGIQDNVIPVRMDTRCALPLMKKLGLTYDLIYIDAAHDSYSVARDCYEALPLLSLSGIVCGDDYNWRSVRQGLRLANLILFFKTKAPLHFYVKENRFVGINHNRRVATHLKKMGYRPALSINPLFSVIPLVKGIAESLIGR